MRFPLILVILLALIGASPAAVLTQEATPATGPVTFPLASSADEDRPDLAAMALTAADLPAGYVNVDETYFLTAQGFSTFYSGETLSPEEIADLGLISVYDSLYSGEDEGTYLRVYIIAFESPEAVEAGFDVLEDETRVPEDIEVLATQDLPGPDIGEAPSETTLSVVDYRAVGGSLVDLVDITFRVDRFLVGVLQETEVEVGNNDTAATPELDPEREQLVNDVAATFVERIEAVEAGEAVSGVDPSLPPLVLPTDQVWPLPGITAEGYRDPAQILGSLGPGTDFGDAFQSGYSRTAFAGTKQGELYPQPPFVTVGVSTFESPDAALGVLEVADEVPGPGPVPPPQTWEPVETAPIAETDGSSVYRGAFGPGGPVDSARVAFASGDYFVTVDVLGAGSEQAALDAAEDLAIQQAACLDARARCGNLTVPEALETGAAAADAATPGAATPEAEEGAGGDVTILGPEEEYAGVTRGEWDARWWQWALSLPAEINPNVDLTSEGCGYGQAGPVFFLPGNFTGAPSTTTATCVVPEGVAIFVGVGGNECATVEPPPYFGRDEEDLRTCAVAATDGVTNLQASINGEPVPDLETYRVSSPLFPLTLPDDSAFGAPAGVALSVADDYSVIIAPPPPGEYEIAASALYDGEVTLGRTIRVVVQAPQVIEPEATPVATPVD